MMSWNDCGFAGVDCLVVIFGAVWFAGVRVIALSLCENGREVKGFLVISD